MSVLAFLRLIRWVNLLIMAATQYAVYYCLLKPAIKSAFVPPALSHQSFALLCLSTVLIGAAGYIINDYYDIRIDQINKPEKVMIGKIMRRRIALALHIGINALGLLIAFLVAWSVGMPRLVFLHAIAALLLYKYSENYKRQFLSGNIMISLLTALVVILPLAFETKAIIKLNGIQPEMAGYVVKAVFVYAAFAFVTTFIREIVKDAEDLEGDLDSNCRTLPILLGTRRTKNLLAGLLLLVELFLAGIFYIQSTSGDAISALYLFFGVMVPGLLTAWHILKARDKDGFSKASTWLKLMMTGGILSMPVYFYIYLYL